MVKFGRWVNRIQSNWQQQEHLDIQYWVGESQLNENAKIGPNPTLQAGSFMDALDSIVNIIICFLVCHC